MEWSLSNAELKPSRTETEQQLERTEKSIIGHFNELGFSAMRSMKAHMIFRK